MWDTKTLELLVGLPGSGKSEYAKKCMDEEGFLIVSSDETRKQLYGSESIQGDPKEVFSQVLNKVKHFQESRSNIVVDACNLSRKRRIHFLNMVKHTNYETKITTLICDLDLCIRRASNRERKVSKDVVVGMCGGFNVPIFQEGQSLSFVATDQEKYKTKEMIMEEAVDFEQNNKHHELTVGKHCEGTKNVLVRDYKITDSVLLNAAMYHDVGKLYTQKFETFYGTPTTDAHYYGHANVSAYIFLSIMRDMGFKYSASAKWLESAYLIENHMLPYAQLSEKAIKKYEKMHGKEFLKNLFLLHDADRKAHSWRSLSDIEQSDERNEVL